MVVPKLGKDVELCSPYRPISLLNVNAKIFTKILASSPNKVILSLIHGNQMGLMPARGQISIYGDSLRLLMRGAVTPRGRWPLWVLKRLLTRWSGTICDRCYLNLVLDPNSSLGSNHYTLTL